MGKLDKEELEQRLKKQIDNIPDKLAADRARTEETFKQIALTKAQDNADDEREVLERERRMKKMFPGFPDRDGK